MALFDPRVLAQASDTITAIPAHHQAILSHWAGMVRSKEIERFKETALDADFKGQVVEGVLGYRPAGHAEGQTVDKEHSIGADRVDLGLGRFGGTAELIAPFELKGAGTRDLDAPMPGRRISPVEQAWGYALAAGRSVRWVLVSNYVEIRLYSYRDGNRSYERFDVGRLDTLDEYRRFVILLSAENLLGGRTADILAQSLAADRRVGDEFYADYQATREALIAEVAATSAGATPEAVVETAQTIIDRVLFVAFAEDRELLPRDLLRHTAEARNAFAPAPVWQNFLGLFGLIDRGGEVDLGGRRRQVAAYNGGLFRKPLAIPDARVSDELCVRLAALGAYDFAERIDVTILGRIFEQSLRDLERHLALARGEEAGDFRTLGRTPQAIKDHGIVYTPEFVARFITDRTLGTHVRELFAEVMKGHAVAGKPSDYASLRFARGNAPKQARDNELAAWRAYRDRLMGLRVVDPACGSGIFLVTAFDLMAREYARTNAKIGELAGAPELWDIDAEILSRNLYGVDVNAASVEISKLSLWLKTAKLGKALDSLEHTIRVGDSLIEDSSFAYLRHGFTWKDAFPEVEAVGGFDVVLGNPPYVRMELIKAMKPYLERRYQVVSDRADLYAYFYERGLRILRPGGRLGYISNNTFFKTGSGRPLRDHLRAEATIEEVADFGDLQIFEGVTTYPAILVMRKAEPPEEHAARFWNVDAVPEGDFGAAFDAAAAPYPQAALGSNSWAFEGDARRALRTKLVAGHPTLGEVFGAPLYGIKTGLNEAFVINRATRDTLVAADPRSDELLRPWLEGKDLRRWRAEPRDLYVVYIPRGRVVIDDFPAIRDHLLPFKAGLEARATRQEWFELQQAQEAYSGRMSDLKIAWTDVAEGSRCHLDQSGSYLANTGYFLPIPDPAVLAYLNSRVSWFLVEAMTPEAQGGYARFQTQFVERLPIPASIVGHLRLAELARAAQGSAERRRDLQRSVLRRIPDLCPPDRRRPDGSVALGRRLESWWTLDFAAFRAEVRSRFREDIPLAERTDWEEWLATTRREIVQADGEVARAEATIDGIVHGLFGLSDAETTLIGEAA